MQIIKTTFIKDVSNKKYQRLEKHPIGSKPIAETKQDITSPGSDPLEVDLPQGKKINTYRGWQVKINDI